jgi:hypothetical protein
MQRSCEGQGALLAQGLEAMKLQGYIGLLLTTRFES